MPRVVPLVRLIVCSEWASNVDLDARNLVMRQFSHVVCGVELTGQATTFRNRVLLLGGNI